MMGMIVPTPDAYYRNSLMFQTARIRDGWGWMPCVVQLAMLITELLLLNSSII